MMGLTTFDEQIKAGKVTFKGDRKTFDQLRVAMSDFELFFEIMPGTGENKPSQQKTKPLQIEKGTIGANID